MTDAALIACVTLIVCAALSVASVCLGYALDSHRRVSPKPFAERPRGLVEAPEPITPISNPEPDMRTCSSCGRPYESHVAMRETRCYPCVQRAVTKQFDDLAQDQRAWWAGEKD
jgi:hypothetical protein